MAMTKLSEVVVGSGGASTIQFSNIPQNGTDLLILASCRTATTSANIWDSLMMQVNGTNSSGSVNYLAILNTSVSAGTDTQGAIGFGAQTGSTTANTFSNAQLYVSNYSTSSPLFSSDGVNENNSNSGAIVFASHSPTSPAAVTSLTFTPTTGSTLLQHSVVSLYIIS